MAQVDYFLKIDGIKGESLDADHKGEIEVESFSWGLSNARGASGGGGRATGKNQFTGFDFGALSTSASPQIVLQAVTGKHIKQAVLTGRRAGGEGEGREFLKIKFTDVLISSYQQSAMPGSGENLGNNEPMDQVTLNFAKFEFSMASPTGDLTEPTVTGWDVEKDQGL